MLSKERVEEILKESGVLMEGHFLLTSGRHSNKYMQCARILEQPHFTKEIGKHLAEHFKDEKVDIVIGPAMGGIIMSYEVARQLGCRNLFAEREDGKMALRRGFNIPKGARVVVAEDVVTTGGSVQEVIDIVKEQGGEVIGVAVLVDRSNGTVDFGTRFVPAYRADVVSYEAEACPICQKGDVELVKPGSRKLSTK